MTPEEVQAKLVSLQAEIKAWSGTALSVSRASVAEIGGLLNPLSDLYAEGQAVQPAFQDTVAQVLGSVEFVAQYWMTVHFMAQMQAGLPLRQSKLMTGRMLEAARDEANRIMNEGN